MDQALLELLNPLVSWPGLRQLCWLVAQPWAALIVVLAVLADLAWRRRWWQIPIAAVAVISADLLCARLLKPWLARPRPCAGLEDVLAPFGCGSGSSMPSCHAANIFALAAVIHRPWAWGLAALVALSRVVIGVHYPSDVLVGAAVGVLLGGALRLMASRSRRRRTDSLPSQ